MAAALANIDKKLDAIQESQQEMMDFLVQKEKAKPPSCSLSEVHAFAKISIRKMFMREKTSY
jgi:hypothetical protein